MDFLPIIKSFPVTRISDLGCGNPFLFFNLFNNHVFSYHGVDKKNEFEAYYHLRNELPEMESFIPGELIYNQFLQCSNEYVEKDHFKKYFSFDFNTEIQDFLDNNKNQQFEIIVLSDVLHKFNKPAAFKILKESLELLAENGVIYISVITSNYKDEDDCYNLNDFSLLKKELNIIWVKESTESVHLQLLGSKPPLIY